MTVKTLSESLISLPNHLNLVDILGFENIEKPILNLQILCPCGDVHIIHLSDHNSTQHQKNTQGECDHYRHLISNKGIVNKEGGYRKVMVVIEKNLG